MCLNYIYFLHIDNTEHHFSFWSHLGMGLASLQKPLKPYMWRLHLQLPNGFQRQPEYSSFLFLWVPGQLDSNVKHCCKLRKSTEQRPIYLLFKAPPLSPLSLQYWSAYNLCEYKTLFQLHWGGIVCASLKTMLCLNWDCSF